MKSNIDRSVLDEFVKDINEARNTLSYSLNLSIPSIDEIGNSNDDDNPIDSIVNFTYKECYPFLNQNDFSLYGTAECDCPNLTALSGQPNFWERLFNQDAILSCFIKLRKFLGESFNLTNYKYIKLKNIENTNSDIPINNTSYGLDFLISNNYLTFNETNYSFSKNNNKNTDRPQNEKVHWNSMYVSAASNLKGRVTNIYDKIKNEFNFSILSFCPQKDKYSGCYAFHLMEFYDRILCKQRIKCPYTINTLINAQNVDEKTFSKKTQREYVQCINNLISDLNIPGYSIEFFKNDNDKNSENYHFNLTCSDKIYLLYQIESVFAPIAINCMYHQIKSAESEALPLNDQAIINQLSTFMKLPNVFSRYYILQMFIDTIKNTDAKNFRDYNFFSRYKNDPKVGMTLHNRYKYNDDELFIFNDLLQNYSTFTLYLETFFFPVYESYVFCSILNYIEQKHNYDSPGKSLIEMYKLLTNYLNNDKLVEKLFSIENTSEYELKPKSLTKDAFLTPDFSNNDTINSSLYQRCIKGKKALFLNDNIPSLINKKYLLSLSPSLEKQILNQYVLASITK